MSRNEITIDGCTPDDVFVVLDDACAYPRWVVGARRIRAVDPDWPSVGARFHHAVGPPVGELHDFSRILQRDPPHHLRLEVRLRPIGEAIVDLRVAAGDEGTRIEMCEQPTAGPVAWVPGAALNPLLWVRNQLSLRRLRRAVQASRSNPS